MRDQPIRVPAWMNASETLPDWAIAGDAAAAEPGVDVADVRRARRGQVDHAHAVRAEDGRAGRDRDLADLAPASAAAASPPSTTPPPGITTVRTPASAASRVNRGGAQRIDREDDGVGHLGQRGEVRVARRARRPRRTSGSRSSSGCAPPIAREVVADRRGDAGARATRRRRRSSAGRRAAAGRCRGRRDGRRVARAPSPDHPVDASRVSRARAMTAAGSRSCPPRSGPRAARGGSARPGTRACSPARRRPGRRGRRSGRPPRTRTAWRPTPWRGRPCGSAP